MSDRVRRLMRAGRPWPRKETSLPRLSQKKPRRSARCEEEETSEEVESQRPWGGRPDELDGGAERGADGAGAERGGADCGGGAERGAAACGGGADGRAISPRGTLLSRGG